MQRFFDSLNRLSPVELGLVVALVIAVIIAAAIVFAQLQPAESDVFDVTPTNPNARAGQITEEELQLTRDAITAIAPTLDALTAAAPTRVPPSP